MRTARLVGPTADGTSVVLLTEDGEELTVPLDPDDPTTRSVLEQVRDRLTPDGGAPTEPAGPAGPADEAPQVAPAGPPPAPAQARRPPRRRETPMDTTLSPRDIQTRIRAGESLEDLVAASGMDPERVERFAAPVLAEREHMALTALSGSVRRRGEGSGNRPLRTVVAERLLGQGVDADEVAWDAWKREDGQWQVSADYALLDQERHAEFRFDPQGRFSLAEDDDARWLSGERPSPVAAVVDRDDELALVRATSEPGHEVGHEDLRESAGHSPDASDADLDDEFHLDADVEVTERLEVTERFEVVEETGPEEDLASVLQAVPPAELSLEELVALATTDPGSEDADEDSPEAGAGEPDARSRARDEAAEPTIAVVRHLTSVSVEVDVPADASGSTEDEAVEDARSALDTLYDMLGGDGYAEDSVNVYAGLSDAAAVPVVDEHEFEAPTAVVVPADPGPDPADVTVGAEVGELGEADESEVDGAPTSEPDAEDDVDEEPEPPAARDQDGPTEPEDVALPGMEDEPAVVAPSAAPEAAAPEAASPEAAAEATHDAAEAPPVPDVDEPLIPSPGASRKPGRRKRASVPSWDEIMFGGPKQS